MTALAPTMQAFFTDRLVRQRHASPQTVAAYRDTMRLLLAIQTGLRASELTGLTCGDIHLGTGAHVTCHGKGRKNRVTPLTKATAGALRLWLTERQGAATDPLFPTSTGRRLSRDALERRLARGRRSVAEPRRAAPGVGTAVAAG